MPHPAAPPGAPTPPAALSPAELDREYNARAAIPDHPAIFADWAERSRAARRRSLMHEHLAYGTSAAERIDVFPAAGDGCPAVLFLHGGYWRSLDKSDFSFLAPPLNAAGLTVAVCNYGLLPAVTLAEIVAQCQRALVWLWRTAPALSIDRSRLVVAGHSAGGHLAAMLLATHWPTLAPDLPANPIRGALTLSGLFDLDPLRHTTFLARELSALDAATARELSPAQLAPATDAPLITAVGAQESAEFHRQSALMSQAWPGQCRAAIIVANTHHLNVVETLTQAESPVFASLLALAGATR